MAGASLVLEIRCKGTAFLRHERPQNRGRLLYLAREIE